MQLKPGDFVELNYKGRTVVASVVSLHPEEGREYVIVSRLTKNGRVSKARRNWLLVHWKIAEQLVPIRPKTTQ